MIWRLTRNLSRGDLQQITSMNNSRSSNKLWKEKVKKDNENICQKCGKNCGNVGLLAMHINTPGKAYRAAHRKFDEEEK